VVIISLEPIMSVRPLVPAVIVTLLTACMSASAVTPRVDLLGTPVPPTAATRVVTLTPGMHSINVISGDTVRFIGSGSEFAWSFDTSPIVQVFDLNQVAPSGALAQQLRVYVAPNPLYSERAEFNDPDRRDTRVPAAAR
jgi:hypothetical protein